MTGKATQGKAAHSRDRTIELASARVPHPGAQFTAVRDSRNRRVPGLYQRNGRYDCQLWVHVGAGKKAPRRFPLSNAHNLPAPAMILSAIIVFVLYRCVLRITTPRPTRAACCSLDPAFGTLLSDLSRKFYHSKANSKWIGPKSYTQAKSRRTIIQHKWPLCLKTRSLPRFPRLSLGRCICGDIPLIIWLPGNRKVSWMTVCSMRLVNGSLPLKRFAAIQKIRGFQ